jgi:hypothetical protein
MPHSEFLAAALEAAHVAADVVIADHPGETHDGAGGLMDDQVLMLAQQQGLLGDSCAHDPGHQ